MGMILVLCLGLVTTSCKKKNDEPSNNVHNKGNATNTRQIQLIRKLENPYSVTNMQLAYDNLNSLGVSLTGINVTTTHKYIKFKPQNNQEFDILKYDSTLVLYSYPLDYEMGEGYYYQDPTISDSLPTFQYCAVPVNQVLPVGVAYEVLEHLYIPDERKTGQSQTNEEAIDALVEEALKITDNLDENTNGKVTLSSWTPAGRIRVLDNSDTVTTWLGVEGVQVRARRWFTTHKGITNVNGQYTCNGSFKRDAKYSLDWERYDFALSDGWLNGAGIDGPKMRGNWDSDLQGRDNQQAFQAKVFMAAYHYYYKDIKSLSRPPENSIHKTQLRIRCHNEPDEDNGFHNPIRRFLGLGSAVHIYNQEIDSPSGNIRHIYATTIHELAHAAHWNFSWGGHYTYCEDIVAESWARGVQWDLTRMVWPTYDIVHYRKKLMDSEDDPKHYNYSGLVKDMIDFDNTLSDIPHTDGDPVSDYLISQIERSLMGTRHWNDWKNSLKNTYNNATKTKLDSLFDAWN